MSQSQDCSLASKGLGFSLGLLLGMKKTYLCFAGNEGLEKNIETSTIMGYIGTTVRIHSLIPS